MTRDSSRTGCREAPPLACGTRPVRSWRRCECVHARPSCSPPCCCLRCRPSRRPTSSRSRSPSRHADHAPPKPAHAGQDGPAGQDAPVNPPADTSPAGEHHAPAAGPRRRRARRSRRRRRSRRSRRRSWSSRPRVVTISRASPLPRAPAASAHATRARGRERRRAVAGQRNTGLEDRAAGIAGRGRGVPDRPPRAPPPGDLTPAPQYALRRPARASSRDISFEVSRDSPARGGEARGSVAIS